MNQTAQGFEGGRYKRAKNLEMWLRDRDEDLALFHDMRTRERSNFLHPSSVDIEASLSSELGGMSGYRFSVSAPTHTGPFDLLSRDTEKNDYDWLLTPPGTPLFPSLEQEIPVVSFSSKRSLNQSASAAKSFRISHLQEPSPKVLRASSSPRRTSTTSSTSSSSSIRGRVSSSSTRSSSPNLRPSTPSGRSSTPTGRASGGVGRSSSSVTPTLRRTNTTPTLRSSSVGISGAKNRGSLLSPKFQARHPVSLPGFSSEPPPNLRTSISDMSSSFSRGRSFGLKHGVTVGTGNVCFDASETSRPSWPLTSPITSRSTNSSHSQDQCNSQTSKGSIISSYDDVIEIYRPSVADTRMEDTECTFTGPKCPMKMGDEQGCKYSFPGKQKRSLATSMVTSCGASNKKHFELPVRQMDHHRSSQTMFRPLLSSAPTSSFYSSRHSIAKKTVANPVQECSTTISRNANRGGSVVHGHEITDNGDDRECDREKSKSLRIPARKIVLDEDKMVKLDGVGSSHDLHPCRRESLTGVQNGIEINLTECVRLEGFDGRIQNDSKANVYEVEISEVKQKLLVDGFVQGSADAGLTGADFCKDSLSIQCREKNTDYLFLTEETEVLASNLALDTDEMTTDLIDHDLNLYPYRSENVDGCETETEMKLSTEWVQLESFDDGIVHDSKSEVQEEKIYQIKKKPLMDGGVAYVSAHDGLTRIDSYRDDGSFHSREEDINHLFGDIQEVLSHGSKLQESIAEKCYYSVQSAGTEDPQVSQPFILTCASKQGVLKHEVGAVLESGMESPHGVQGIMCFQVCEYGLNMDLKQRDNWGDHPENCFGQESPKNVSSCEKSQQGSTLLSRSFTLEEATDTILFCSSIVHDIVYRAAEAAIEEECNSGAAAVDGEVNSVPTQNQTGDAVKLAGMDETGYRNSSQAKWKRPPVEVGSTVRRTLTYVQKKQRSIFQHTPSVTHQQYLMEQTGTAIIENADASTQMITKVPQKDYLKVTKVKSRCKCTVM